MASSRKQEERLQREKHGVTFSLSTFMYNKTIRSEMHVLTNPIGNFLKSAHCSTTTKPASNYVSFLLFYLRMVCDSRQK